MNAPVARPSVAPSEEAPPGRFRFARVLRGSNSGAIGATIVIFTLIFVIVGPWVWRINPALQDLSVAIVGPSAQHPLGTDDQGRDLLARLMVGGRMSLIIGFLSMLIALLAGSALGIAAAYSKGVVEAVCMRLTDSLLALPGIVQAVIFAAVLGHGVGPLIVALGIYGTPIFSRIAYTATRQVMNQDYFAAAKVIGAGPLRIVFLHVLPNIATPLMTVGTLRIGSNILTGAALSFFGLGVQPPEAEWGLMIADARQFSWEHPLLLLLPGIGLFLASIGFNLLGDGLRDWLDPQSQGR
jgi:peptide/nickel transport system permease protein